MEEVWNDINLSSLHQYKDNTRSTHSRQTIHFQDFFSNKVVDYPTPPPTINDTSFSEDHAIPTKRPSSIASTTLSLSSPEFDDHFQSGFGFPKKTTDHVDTDSTLDISLAPDDNNSIKKRAKDNSENIETNEERKKRLMKCRESADRSRARKQELSQYSRAYTNELEREVDSLRKENAGLRKQITQFYLAVVPVDVPKKLTLSRTLTAPF